MILQSLNDLYQRLSQDPKNGLPQPGFSLQKISFCVVLSPEGELVGIEDARTEETDAKGKTKRIATPMLVPWDGTARTSGVNACYLLSDNAKYMFGFLDENSPEFLKLKEEEKARRRKETKDAFESFRKKHLDLEKQIHTPGFSAICRFFDQWDISKLEKQPEWIAYKKNFGIFKVQGAEIFAQTDISVRNCWLAQKEEEISPEGICLVTGVRAPIARLHQPPIKGVRYAQPGGAFLVSFRSDSFTSYGKEEGFNAPISKVVSGQYTKALNWLLAYRNFQIGDASTVFWTEKKTEAELIIPKILTEFMPKQEQDEALLARMNEFLRRVSMGTLGRDDLKDAKTRFYILGISPNGSRLAVRFWYTGNLGDLLANLKSHFHALEIVRKWDKNDNTSNTEFPRVDQLIRATGLPNRDVSRNLEAGLMRAILVGLHYPIQLFYGALDRCRAERKVSYLCAAIIKAYLHRNLNLKIKVMLDENNKTLGYLLGRLIAVYEKAQYAALGRIKASVVDKYWGKASATPSTVFPTLHAGYMNHKNKAPWTLEIVDKLIDEIKCFPKVLSTEEQGLFVVGYHHQRLYKKSNKHELANDPHDQENNIATESESETKNK